MRRTSLHSTDAGVRVGRFGRCRAIVALAALLIAGAGCNRDEAVRAFRAGASDQLQTGVESIALGLINGAFSAFALGTDDGAGGTTTETP